MGLTALAVRLSSRGPVIYKQRRLTDGSRIFVMYKFRTMLENAERATGAVWAESSDPRVTPVGKFLRKTHLDELPQLLNVLRGDMSLIGPRPERPELLEKLQEELPSFRRRMEVKAGITGLAQTTNGYASCIETYRKKLAFDILYVKNRCFWLDLRIAFRTIYVLLTGSGAH
jgi:lipopolysaccharide/colanic/teichoic acid biosynthesis glycosyltransferase